MSMRSSIRAIAKARLKAMGVPHVNKVLSKIQKQHQPLWRRVTSGRLAKKGYNAQMGIGKRRRVRRAA